MRRNDSEYLRGLLGSLTRPRRVALALSVVAGVLVFLIGETVFPYYTSNHDEAVYLQQAAMLLEGKLALHPPVPEAFRPWFFVADGGRLYPKYMPVVPAIFAVGGLAGSFRLALGLVAAATVGLTYAVVAEVFEPKTGVVAGALLLASPLFLVDASVFLPYVPALCLNLLFAWAYLRADRTGSFPFAALAGGAAGLSFFARPYTAVLFAAPFVLHAVWTLRGLDRALILRQGTTAAVGLCGVAAALGYNAVVTGDPLLFPYEAFAPRDGLGFGEREILDYERDYTVSLALEANARNLLTYATRWTPAGPLGSLVALLGLGTALRRARRDPDPRVLVLAGLVVTVTLGNVYFWGTLNVLGDLSDPSDGLISFLGPYYHVGLLLPTAAFGAVGLRRLADFLRPRYGRLDRRSLRVAALVAVLAGGLAATGVAAGAAVAPLSDNSEVTEQYERAYQPLEDREFDDALVFLPTPYGDWLNHPFQPLRNDPGYDGDAVYALGTREFAVVDAFPDRNYYRFAYRGEWLPTASQPVTPRLQALDHVAGERVGADLAFGVPSATEAFEVRASVGADGDSTAASLPRDGLDVTATVANGTARVTSPHFVENLTVPYAEGEDLKLVVFTDYGSLGGFEYVVRLPVQKRGDSYWALSPHLEVCRNPRLCGGEAAYVPGTHRDGVWMNATLTGGEP